MATAREMANWVFMWDDALLASGVEIDAHPAETAGYVAESLLDADRQTCASFSDTGALEIIFDLSTPQTCLGYGLHNHNCGTKGVGVVEVYYSADKVTWFTAASSNVANAIGDDDFFKVFGDGGHSARYWALYFSSVDSAGLYVGRFYLAKSLYELPNGPAIGATKGYVKNESVTLTPGGIEHRVSRGLRRRRITAYVPDASTTTRGQIKALVESCDVNDKCFVMSDPFGTTAYATSNRYGAAIHARIDSDSWEHPMKIISLTDLPLNITEVL